MPPELILASRSEIRAQLLRKAAVPFCSMPAPIDEDAAKGALIAEGASPRDVADQLAEMKAIRVSRKHPEALVIGSDQVLEIEGEILSKPTSMTAAKDQIFRLRGRRHTLLTAAVIAEQGRITWRHVNTVRLTMRAFSDIWLDGYLDRNWPGIGHCVGGYQLEEEGIRLFTSIEGDYFSILGLPLLELLNQLTLREVLPS